MQVNLKSDEVEEEYISIGFGNALNAGNANKNSQKHQVKSRPDKIDKKKIETPKVKNKDVSEPLPVKKKKKKKKSNEKKISRDREDNQVGKYGIAFDWGGKTVRKILDYNIPKYPSGVSKEIDLKLKFTILPDGTVGSIIPLIKADTRLEMVAIRALRQWRFEPLDKSKKQTIQKAIIVFPFRLR